MRQSSAPGRILVWLILIGAIAYVAIQRSPAPQASLDHLPPMEIYFSPRGGCTQAIVREIESAQQTIFVQAYSFTSAAIASALVDAHARGVRVEVLLDESQRSEKYTSADFLAHAGIATLIDDRHGIAHNKIMVLDERTVLTGSFNFSKAAEENNAENLLLIRDFQVAKRYLENWQVHRAHSVPFAKSEKTEKKALSPSSGKTKKREGASEVPRTP